MRCIPDQPDFPDGRHAEKALWDALRSQLPDDVVLPHSVHVRHRRAEHEIDILAPWPGVGLAAFEVKGGRVTIENGKWYQSDGSAKRSAQSPIAQSQGAQHAFKEFITASSARPSPSASPTWRTSPTPTSPGLADGGHPAQPNYRSGRHDGLRRADPHRHRARGPRPLPLVPCPLCTSTESFRIYLET